MTILPTTCHYLQQIYSISYCEKSLQQTIEANKGNNYT